MALLNIGIILFAKQIAGLYGLSPEATEMAWRVIITYSSCAIVLWPTGFALPNALRAANDARYTMIVSIGSMWIWRVGLSYLLVKYLGFGLLATWAAMYVDWLFRSICFMLRLVKDRWLRVVV